MFYWYLIIAIFINFVPILRYINIINTLLHELGHVFVSVLTGGKIISVKLYKDASGITQTINRNRLIGVTTTLSGYPFSSILSLLFLYLISMDYYKAVAAILFTMLLGITLSIRNIFGLVWVLTFIMILSFGIVFDEVLYFKQFITLLVAVVLTQSIWTSWVVFTSSILRPGKPSDATHMANKTLIPPVVWGSFFLAQSIFFAIIGIRFW